MNAMNNMMPPPMNNNYGSSSSSNGDEREWTQQCDDEQYAAVSQHDEHCNELDGTSPCSSCCASSSSSLWRRCQWWKWNESNQRPQRQYQLPSASHVQWEYEHSTTKWHEPTASTATEWTQSLYPTKSDDDDQSDDGSTNHSGNGTQWIATIPSTTE